MDDNHSDQTLVLTVEDTFLISGRGRVLAPGLSTTTKLALKPGDAVKLVRPDGGITETVVQGLDAVHSRRTERPEILFFITLPKSVTAEDAPTGTRLVLMKAGDPL